MTSSADALSRTTLLLNREYFDGMAADIDIADGLISTTVRLHANEANLISRAGQCALITGFSLIARMGIGVELSIADVPVEDLVAPLRKLMLREALVDLGSDLVPGATLRSERGKVDLTLVFGDTPCEDEPAIRVFADATSCAVVEGDERVDRITADWPLGAFAAAAAVAPIVLEAALPQIEQAVGGSRILRPRPSSGPPVHLDLRELFPELPMSVPTSGRLDLISGGAITNALLFILLRIPKFMAQVRLIESEVAELSNVNHYMLLRASHEGVGKTTYLEEASSKRIMIFGIDTLFAQETRDGLVPLAGQVLVGVDNVEARWLVQREWPEWLCVGATEAAIAETTTHRPGGPCAGCLHPDALPPDVIIPTISFVSFWAGLLQVCELLSHLDSEQPLRRVMVWPFGLGGSFSSTVSELVSSRRCAISCASHREQVRL